MNSKTKWVELDRILEQTEMQVRELQVLLRQRSADILARVEEDLKAQAEGHAAEVQKHLQTFQAQHPEGTGRAFGTLLEDFLMKEVEDVFQKWRVQEDERIQSQLNELSSRFVAQANSILEHLEVSAGTLFETPIEHLSVSCPLRVESRLHYRVERVFYSLDSFLLLLPGFLLRPILLRRMHHNVPLLLDMNAGRIRYDYVERLQTSMTGFEKDICASLIMVTETLKSAINQPRDQTREEPSTVGMLDSVIRECSQLLQ
jgi:hypothetical protein